MAKGRKLTTSRSERYFGNCTYGNGIGNHHSHANYGSAGITELSEDDVWSSVEHDDESHAHVSDWNSRAVTESTTRGGGGGYSDTIRRGTRDEPPHVGGLSLAFEEKGKTASSSRIVFRSRDSMPRGRQIATSAPVNVPDWRSILRVDSVESFHDSEDWLDDDRESEMMVPPHEYLARDYTRTGKMAVTSVFEGVGRTLKGRDMSRVRDAVWSQTGFDG